MAAICVAAAFAAAPSGGAVVRAAMADGAMVRARVVVDYAARAVAKNRNFTGDLRRAWQHMARAGALRRAGDLAASMRHAIRARDLGRRAIVANGWKLKRAFARESVIEKTLMAGVAVGELDRAVDEIVVSEELSAAHSSR
jgi:hypothetical protein